MSILNSHQPPLLSRIKHLFDFVTKENDMQRTESTDPSESTIIPFTKYQGAGNDLIMIDNRSEWFSPHRQDINLLHQMCDRRFGIGADGIMELCSHPVHTFEARYYNADGRIGTFCGNGARCAVAFAKELGLLVYKESTFLFCGNVHRGIYDEINKYVHIKLNNVSSILKYDDENYFVNTGSPHHVRFVESVAGCDVIAIGKEVRHSARYQESGGTNVNFVQVQGVCEVMVRTFERGVEDETWACGSGSVGSAMVHAYVTGGPVTCDRPQCGHQGVGHHHVLTRGAELLITYESTDYKSFSEVYLIGPAVKTFSGTFVCETKA